MLMDLARPLKEGDTVPITLTSWTRRARTQKIEVRASVRALTAAARDAGQALTGLPHCCNAAISR